MSSKVADYYERQKAKSKRFRAEREARRDNMLTKNDIEAHVKTLRSSNRSADHKSADVIEEIYSQLRMADEDVDSLRYERTDNLGALVAQQ